MRTYLLAGFLLISGCTTLFSGRMAPDLLDGTFVDDYDILYWISANRWTQHPDATYHIKKWNEEEQYLIAQNDENNPSDPGLWTRIDWMELEGTEPFFSWAFCLSAYDAPTAEAAEQVEIADRTNPRAGCNGFPFSRMERVIRGNCSSRTPPGVLC